MDTILAANEEWVASRTEQDPAFFEKLGKPQVPKFFYIGQRAPWGRRGGARGSAAVHALGHPTRVASVSHC